MFIINFPILKSNKTCILWQHCSTELYWIQVWALKQSSLLSLFAHLILNLGVCSYYYTLDGMLFMFSPKLIPFILIASWSIIQSYVLNRHVYADYEQIY